MLTFKCWQKYEIPGKLLQFFYVAVLCGSIVWKAEEMPNKKGLRDAALERPCRLAFVCNYCLIKHAGQLPGSGPLATDTQLYTECLQPPETGPLPRCPASIFAGNLQKKQNKTKKKPLGV